jgi:hypothetical protein
VKDLVLQSDPSVWMEQNIGKAEIIASNECVTIEQEETNKLWAQSILGESKYQEIKDCEVINGGTWAGTSESMTEVFRQVSEGCQTYTGGHPPCQININYVMHTTMKDQVRIPRWSEGFAACLHPCWSPWRMPCWPNMRDQHPVLNPDTCKIYAGTVPNPHNPMIVFNPIWGNNPAVQWADRKIILETPSHPLKGIECVDNPTGKLITIVHGYDRDWDMKVLFEYVYRTPEGSSTLDRYKRYNEEYVKHLPVPRRGLRRLQRASVTGDSFVPHASRIFKRHP